LPAAFVEPVVVAPADLWAAPAPRFREDLPDAEDHAAGRASRRLAADRRPAGQRPRLSARATARSLRHGFRHSESALADRAGRPEPGILRRDVLRVERGAAREMERPRAAAEGLGGGAV